MSDPFAVFNTGSDGKIVKCNATPDDLNAPMAGYCNADGTINQENVIESDIVHQWEDHIEKRFGDEIDAFGQPVVLHQADVFIADGDMRWFLGDAGNGYGFVYGGGRFGRMVAVNRQPALMAIKETLKLTLKVVNS